MMIGITLALASMVACGLLWPLFHAISHEDLVGGGEFRPRDPRLRVFLHRANSLEAIARVETLRRDPADSSADGADFAWGCEADVQDVAGVLIVAHEKSSRGAMSLEEYLVHYPADMPLVLDLKETLSSVEARSRLLETLRRHGPDEVLLASFDARLLRQIGESTGGIGRCYLSWHINPRKNHFLRIYEFYQRRFGSLGEPVKAGDAIDILAYPWQSAQPDLVHELQSRNIRTLAGGVDSEDAFRNTWSAQVYGIFTDSPDLVRAMQLRSLPSRRRRN